MRPRSRPASIIRRPSPYDRRRRFSPRARAGLGPLAISSACPIAPSQLRPGPIGEAEYSMSRNLVSLLLLVPLLLSACAGGPAARSDTAVAPEPKAQTRLVAAIRSAPPTMVDYLQSAGSFSGASHMVRLASAGLAWTNDQGVRVPQSAEALPTAAH